MVPTFWPDRRLRRRAHRAAISLILGLLLIRTVRDHHDAITRESPVDFSLLHERSQQALSQPEKPVRYSNGSHIDDRYEYERTLQAGQQGSVFLYKDTLSAPPKLVIVKTISAKARNQLPPQLLATFGNITSTWPSEIDATLFVPTTSHQSVNPYVPVHDYFVLQTGAGDSQDWSWALVTPYISGGTLDDLAQELRSIGRTAQIDEDYRSTFYNLLCDLQDLHSQGFCHDDVKPRNIFIDTPKSWLLGDLGNTRETNHPWHNTNLWRRNNRWSNCSLEDTRRALKSYLTFLREASHDRKQFDLDFLDSRTEWAQMYWSFVWSPSAWSSAFARDPKWHAEDYDEDTVSARASWYSTIGSTSLKAVAVQQELACMRIWWRLWLTF